MVTASTNVCGRSRMGMPAFRAFSVATVVLITSLPPQRWLSVMYWPLCWRCSMSQMRSDVFATSRMRVGSGAFSRLQVRHDAPWCMLQARSHPLSRSKLKSES